MTALSAVSASSSPGRWRQRYRTPYDDDDLDGPLHGGEQEQPMFTPLVGRRASAFSASQTMSDLRGGPALFLGDIERAVGRYEFNMRLFAGDFATQGSVFNRYT